MLPVVSKVDKMRSAEVIKLYLSCFRCIRYRQQHPRKRPRKATRLGTRESDIRLVLGWWWVLDGGILRVSEEEPETVGRKGMAEVRWWSSGKGREQKVRAHWVTSLSPWATSSCYCKQENKSRIQLKGEIKGMVIRVGSDGLKSRSTTTSSSSHTAPSRCMASSLGWVRTWTWPVSRWNRKTIGY